jgi:glycosyltransferase involved in cell wall biosynthesis
MEFSGGSSRQEFACYMRVLFFSPGLGVHEQRFLRVLAASRHQIFFLALNDTPELPSSLQEMTQVFWPENRFSVKAPLISRMPALLEILQYVQPDLVHAGPVQTCGFLSVLCEYCPTAVMSWGSDLLAQAELDPLDRWIATFTLRHTDVFICDADCVRKQAESLRGGAFRKIAQFPWGVDLLQCRPSEHKSRIRSALGWDECFVLVSTRNWEVSYDLFVLLEAFAKAQKELSTLRLILLSSGSLKSEVESFIRDQDLQNSIYCPGRVDESEIASYLQASDVYVSSAPCDGSSISLLQAFAAGLPVIVADAFGNREWVTDESGWLAQVGSKASYKDRILEAAKVETEARKHIARNNRNIAEVRADWKANSRKLIELYDELEREMLTDNCGRVE